MNFVMRLLALDIGTRRTGVAYYDDATKIVLPLDTITHTSVEELLTKVEKVIALRMINHVYIGLPLLPSGVEGAQASSVRSFGSRLQRAGIPHSFVDERYTTPRGKDSDGDAQAACSLLQTRFTSNHTDRS